MANVVNVQVTNNTNRVLTAFDQKMLTALMAVGLQAEGYAKLELENSPRRVDTGLLRNSITFAIDGEKTNITDYKASKPDADGNIQSGTYSGTPPKESGNKRSVFLGTNVEYAPYVEYGTSKMEANHFMKNAISKHVDEYKQIFNHYAK